MATISLEKSLLNEMSHIMGNDDLMTQTIKFVRSIRRKAKSEKAEWEYVPTAETRAVNESYRVQLVLQDKQYTKIEKIIVSKYDKYQIFFVSLHRI